MKATAKTLLASALAIGLLAAHSASAQVLTSAGFVATSNTSTGNQNASNPVLSATGSAPGNLISYNATNTTIPTTISGNNVTDWIVFNGSSPNYTYTRLSGGSSFSPISLINGANSANRTITTENTADRFSWAGGSPVASGSATGANALKSAGNASAQTNNGNGFSFTLPATTSTQYLTIWAGSYEAWGTLTATLGDGSAGPLTILWGYDNNSWGTNWRATISFAALTNTTLTVNMTQTSDLGNFDNIWLSTAATTAVIPEPSTYALLAGGLAGLAVYRRRRS